MYLRMSVNYCKTSPAHIPVEDFYLLYGLLEQQLSLFLFETDGPSLDGHLHQFLHTSNDVYWYVKNVKVPTFPVDLLKLGVRKQLGRYKGSMKLNTVAEVKN